MRPARPLPLFQCVAAASAALFMVAWLAATVPLRGQTTVFESSRHGHPETGVQRIPEEGPGACAQCHDQHASRNGVPNGGPFDHALFTIDDETLCYECHAGPSASEVYLDNVTWADSSHSTSPAMYWRGPDPRARSASDAGKCVNCHDPHATADGTGVIPSMLRLREESLCLGCHDGVAGADVKTQTTKAWGHPIAQTARHAAAEGLDPAPAQYDDSGGSRRHAECADCHNPHAARSGFATTAPEASQRLHGVARISVTNGAAGTTPAYTWKGASDLVDVREYEVCFKCHSSWTQLPLGKPDLALRTNPNNPSYHPIQAQGKNANIAAAAFEPGWAWDSLVYCSDCHGSDDPLVRGPHGSVNRSILKAPSPSTSASQTMASTDLCFSCHVWAVYGDATASAATQQASRFNRPDTSGHAFHVGSRDVPCYACHETHGSTVQPGLVVTGRNPGLIVYTQTAGGGTCTPTCHGAQSYGVNYGR